MDSIDKKNLLRVLKRLLSAYPDRRPDSSSLHLYVESLADIPPWLLRSAVEAHIQRSIWFPKVAELRRIAAELSGIHDPTAPQAFAGLPPYRCGYLSARAIELEEAFYHTGRLDPAEWGELADQLERADRPHRAKSTRCRLRRHLESKI